MNWKKELYPSTNGRLILNFTDASVMFALDILSSSECGAYARKTHTLTHSHTCKKIIPQMYGLECIVLGRI